MSVYSFAGGLGGRGRSVSRGLPDTPSANFDTLHAHARDELQGRTDADLNDLGILFFIYPGKTCASEENHPTFHVVLMQFMPKCEEE